MNKRIIFISGGVLLFAAALVFVSGLRDRGRNVYLEAQQALAAATKTAILAGGCFWCVEADFEKLPGVLDVVSGYSGGQAAPTPRGVRVPSRSVGKNPTYKNYAAGGYREVVQITYDPGRVSYAELVEYLIKHGDPTDADGSFYDRGKQYAPAVYYETEEEKKEAERVFRQIDELKIYGKPLAVALLPRSPFYPAEDYHQDYARRNSLKYSYYRHASGRDAFIEKHWGGNTMPSLSIDNKDNMYTNFKKPPDDELRQKLTPAQYKVTQGEGTEPAFRNEYWNNKEEGIYVDILSGEPLFSSLDKFDSGTGWPSFTKPLEERNIVLKEDSSLLQVRTEVRSRYADSHLGHVFKDAPPELGGLRYCMNSAALRFIPKEKLIEEGYERYADLF